MLVKVDVWLDGVSFLLGSLTVANIHPYITIKMALAKKSDELANAAKAAKAAQKEQQATTTLKTPPAGAARRRKA